MTNRHPGMIRVGRAALLAIGVSILTAPTPSPVLAGEDAKKVAWRDDLGHAQAEAKSRDLLLWIQFTGPWCGNCRRMERAAFAHAPIVAESAERFVPVKLRADEHEALAQSLGLSVLPSTVLVRPNGEVVDKFEGYGEPEEFEKFLHVALTAEGRSAAQVAARLRSRAEAEARLRGKDAAVALAGYDPVSLLQDQRLVPGRTDLSAEHDGRVFRFANEADRAEFLRKPASFAPVNGGRCPVSQVDRGDFATGDPRWGVVYDGHLFLFKEVADRDRFVKDPERYAGVDRSIRTTCPHCRESSESKSLARRLTNRFSTMFASHPTASPAPARPTAAASADPAPAPAGRLAAFPPLDAILRR